MNTYDRLRSIIVVIVREGWGEAFYSLPTTKTTPQGFRYTRVGTSNGYATNGGFCLWHTSASCL